MVLSIDQGICLHRLRKQGLQHLLLEMEGEERQRRSKVQLVFCAQPFGWREYASRPPPRTGRRAGTIAQRRPCPLHGHLHPVVLLRLLAVLLSAHLSVMGAFFGLSIFVAQCLLASHQPTPGVFQHHPTRKKKPVDTTYYRI